MPKASAALAMVFAVYIWHKLWHSC
jgi:hypothetical protein